MKKRYVILLVALAFSIGTMFGGSALAYKAVAVFINGQRLDDTGSMAMIYNDRVFVPLRMVSESLGATVGWNAERNSAYIATQRDALTDIEIVGTDEFKKGMSDALQLLKDKLPGEYLLVGKYVKRIELSPFVNNPQMMTDSMTVYISAKEFRPDPIWWAAGLVHEAIHSKQAYDGRNGTIQEYEREAYQKDIESLTKLGAPDWMIQYNKEAMNKATN
jgi:hypothetical protein